MARITDILRALFRNLRRLDRRAVAAALVVLALALVVGIESCDNIEIGLVSLPRGWNDPPTPPPGFDVLRPPPGDLPSSDGVGGEADPATEENRVLGVPGSLPDPSAVDSCIPENPIIVFCSWKTDDPGLRECGCNPISVVTLRGPFGERALRDHCTGMSVLETVSCSPPFLHSHDLAPGEFCYFAAKRNQEDLRCHLENDPARCQACPIPR